MKDKLGCPVPVQSSAQPLCEQGVWSRPRQRSGQKTPSLPSLGDALGGLGIFPLEIVSLLSVLYRAEVKERGGRGRGEERVIGKGERERLGERGRDIKGELEGGRFGGRVGGRERQRERPCTLF